MHPVEPSVWKPSSKNIHLQTWEKTAGQPGQVQLITKRDTALVLFPPKRDEYIHHNLYQENTPYISVWKKIFEMYILIFFW